MCLGRKGIMQFKFISVFAFVAVLPAFAVAKLPTVNVSGTGVSASSAFGEGVSTMRGTVSVTPAKRVVSRSAAKKTNVKYAAKKSDVDVLTPNLPSSNLWAENTVQNDAPLRMPYADEVAVLNNDFELPAEDLEPKFTLDKPVANDDFDFDAATKRMAEINAKLDKIAELQERANASVKRANLAKNTARDEDEEIRVSRVVVPMDEPDVLIRSVEKHTAAPRTAAVKQRDSLAGLSPTELRKAFRKTFLSENKHLSALRDTSVDDMDTTVTTEMAGFTAEQNLSEMGSGIRPFEIKVGFRNTDSALSRDNYTLLTTFAGIVVNDPKRAVQILIPNDATIDSDDRKLTARRLAIIEQVLRDTGIPEQRIMPVLSNREDDGALVLRNIDSTQYEILTKQQRNQFGKKTNKTYKSMTW